MAERAWGLPARLLEAIGRVESGRYDTMSHSVRAWPWTINAQGQGYFYPDKATAIAAAQRFIASGIRSIDVGCMQINLHHHPDAFASLQEAFDPYRNADYAARFLRGLFTDHPSWSAAAGAYHSLTPEFGAPYARKVMAVWHGGTEGDLFATPPQEDPGTHIVRPFPFGRPFALPTRGFAPKARVIPLGGHAMAPGVLAGTGRSLAAYRTVPIRLASTSPLRLAGLP
ncbi:hypothetical protein AA103196_1954 [Ameyamaea chiangmaiensis NBRC 103196]|nr:lytic transglycosylase domain-containing protein [Ameyamaea chiangmaiensis]GBQ68475.1 hypothetical protein AA103196_1954 [Ameyamaea chiangmaiensis NBRC 103196]